MKEYTPLEYLQIDIANHYGHDLDKRTFNIRLKWFQRHEQNLEKLANEADDYYRFNAAVMAYRKAEKGEAIGYLVGMDACSSGPQIMAVVTGDSKGARNTCLIGTRRVDLYDQCTNQINKLLDGQDKIYDRKEIKYVLMP